MFAAAAAAGVVVIEILFTIASQVDISAQDYDDDLCNLKNTSKGKGNIVVAVQ